MLRPAASRPANPANGRSAGTEVFSTFVMTQFPLDLARLALGRS